MKKLSINLTVIAICILCSITSCSKQKLELNELAPVKTELATFSIVKDTPYFTTTYNVKDTPYIYGTHKSNDTPYNTLNSIKLDTPYKKQ